MAFEEALAQQTVFGDEQLEEAATALVVALRPAAERLALALATEAAQEVSAQLPEAVVRVVIEGGEPILRVESDAEDDVPVFREDLEARLTLRLPSRLKGLLEEAAVDAGDSVNAHVVETLNKALHRDRRTAGRRFTGTIET